MDAKDLAGWLLVIGPVLFGIGAGDPYLVRAWTAQPAEFHSIVAAHTTAWRATNLLFVAGTVVTAAGLASLPSFLPDGWARAAAMAGVVAFAIAAVLWIIVLIFRLTVTPGIARDFADSATPEPAIREIERLNAGLFKGFIVIGLGGLAAVGIAIAAGGPIPAAVGWGSAALSGLLVSGLVRTGDLPPFTVYLAPLAFGIALLVGSS
jgi:hypothetical protein